MSWLNNFFGGNQQPLEDSQENPPISWKELEKREYDLGYTEGGDEDGALSSARNRGRETRREVDHNISCQSLKW